MAQRVSTKRKGFTLIELLVVITIIGILATGATATYTSQIQKARDTSRINDLKTLQSATEQYYQDFQVYPDTAVITASTGIVRYASKIPRDQKIGQTCAKYSTQTNPATTPCGYVYNVSEDDNNIEGGAYEVATGFENKGNVDSKAFNDDNGGTYGVDYSATFGTKDASRLELGIRTRTGVDTQVTVDATAIGATTAGACGDGTSRTMNAQASAHYSKMPVILCGNN